MNSDAYARKKSIETQPSGAARTRSADVQVGILESMLALIERILAFLFSDRLKIVTKGVVTLGCVLGFIGLAGGLEKGAIAFPVAFVIGAIMSVIEVLCIRE